MRPEPRPSIPATVFSPRIRYFASTCKENGIVFIGPPSSAIDAMGSKITARQTMKDAGVPIVPGIEEGISDPQEAAEIADAIGYPIILKPAAGGGGIGMKIVQSREELLPALTSSQSVARSAFGDDTIYIEKYLTEPRHIEFQILADNYGKTIYVSDRECSIQRRHQKLIEESPSPVMTEELRQRMGSIAVKAAKAIGYSSAGTVEFMYSRGDFYFLEMNTRLQVEHPITEMVTGVDLAKEQIMVAAGYPLGYDQSDMKINGWAIECRINAEDPLNDFAPCPGKIKRYRSPGGPGIRVDSGVYTGYVIPPYYDSLISKLVAHGKDRKEAIARMERALYEYIIVGVKTNLIFHKAVLRNKRFRSGDINTHFIKDENIVEAVKIVAVEDYEKGMSLASALGADNRQIAAISAAVGILPQPEQGRGEELKVAAPDILSFLISGEWVSGEEMAKRLAISRAAVWKQIQVLRQRGYEISASTGKGYRLAKKPDLLDADRISGCLKTKWLGRDMRISGRGRLHQRGCPLSGPRLPERHRHPGRDPDTRPGQTLPALGFASRWNLDESHLKAENAAQSCLPDKHGRERSSLPCVLLHARPGSGHQVAQRPLDPGAKDLRHPHGGGRAGGPAGLCRGGTGPQRQ